MSRRNEFDQPIGPDLGGWKSPLFPPAVDLVGTEVVLTPTVAGRDGPALLAAYRDAPLSLWTYLPYGPVDGEQDLIDTLRSLMALPDNLVYTIVAEDVPVGFMSYLRTDPGAGVIEIGAITFSPRLQRTRAATEALFLMISNVFGLGYRRCEWKCDDLNTPSRRAADRLGFRYEGTFRRATHYKGRSRDTAWYAITADDWAGLEAGFVRWLEPTNFDEDGNQRSPLHRGSRRQPATATVQIENDAVRVTRFDFGPGAETEHHRHGYDYVVVPLTSGTLRIEPGDGDAVEAPLRHGVAYTRAAGVEHNVVNGENTDFAFIEIELLDRPG